MTRQEHLDWCKKRQGHSGIELGTILIINRYLSIPDEMRKFIGKFI